MDKNAELSEQLKGHPDLRLVRVGRIDLGTFSRPEVRHGAMFITREKVDERGKLWVFIPLSEELVEDGPPNLADIILEMAEDQLEVMRAA
jgi:hypothetical protein